MEDFVKNKVMLWKYVYEVSFCKDLVVNNKRMKIIMKIIVFRSRLKIIEYVEVIKLCLFFCRWKEGSDWEFVVRFDKFMESFKCFS